MKFALLFIILLSGIVRADDYELRGNLQPPPDMNDFKELNRAMMIEGLSVHKDLKRVKYFLINGDTRRARVYLRNLAHSQSRLKPVIYRYLGMLYFMEGQFSKSLETLSRRELQTVPHYGKICTVKVLNQLVLSKTLVLWDEWSRCKAENARTFKEANLPWLDTLVDIKLNPKNFATSIPFRKYRLPTLENEDLKVFLKLGLYLNQEALIAEQLPQITQEQLQDAEVREIVAQIYFRNGMLAKSYKFVEDLKSPNAENIKGNLYLLRTKYEVAYAQFKLALEVKQNSQNALERLIPLAWLLGDWEGGVAYSQRIVASPTTQMNKLTLIAAFHMQRGEYEKAKDILRTINQTSKRGSEKDVTQLSSFVGLMENDGPVTRRSAHASCSQYDLVNCWVEFQMGQWDSFPLTLRRKDVIVAKNDWEKLTTDDLNDPLKEVAYVNQPDIEELDDQLIQLVPKATP